MRADELTSWRSAAFYSIESIPQTQEEVMNRWPPREFSDLELDLLSGAFLAYRYDVLRLAKVQETTEPLFQDGDSAEIAITVFTEFVGDPATDLKQECLTPERLASDWFVLKGEARAAAAAYWEALHANDIVVRPPGWFRSGVTERAFLKRLAAVEEVQKTVPLFCQRKSERELRRMRTAGERRVRGELLT